MITHIITEHAIWTQIDIPIMIENVTRITARMMMEIIITMNEEGKPVSVQRQNIYKVMILSLL